MKEGLPPNSGADAAQDARPIPQPREHRPETMPTQTTADTEPGCGINPDALREEINQQQIGLKALEVETYRRMATKLREFLED